MVQKIIVLERDTKEELQQAIEKNVLQQNNMRLITFSVLEQPSMVEIDGQPGFDPDGHTHYEAWCVVDVPEKQEKFYNKVMGIV